MMQCTVSPISDYDATREIHDVVQAAIRADTGIFSMLEEGNPDRLVVVKPNWVQQSHEYDADLWLPVITHPTLILAVVEQLARAMQGEGSIVICDAPHTYADFEAILARGSLRTALEELQQQFPEIRLEIVDLRREVWIRKEEVIVQRIRNSEDPRGYARLDLGKHSLFFEHGGEGRFYGADYDTGEVNRHHHDDIHEYLLAGTPITCDLFVNMPKLKTHKKTGLTCCLKNLVGINGDKNWLPHHTEGGPQRGGDEFPHEAFLQRFELSAKRTARAVMSGLPILGPWMYRKMRNAGKRVLGDSETVIRNGNWSGNDTCWRMALDLNRALLYGNPDGTWRDVLAPKRYLAIVDGIIGGQGNGPICPEPIDSGVLITGCNPAVVDAVACRVMGFDPAELPIVAHAFDDHRWRITDDSLHNICVLDERIHSAVDLHSVRPSVPGGFKPHFGWSDIQHTA